VSLTVIKSGAGRKETAATRQRMPGSCYGAGAYTTERGRRQSFAAIPQGRLAAEADHACRRSAVGLGHLLPLAVNPSPVAPIEKADRSNDDLNRSWNLRLGAWISVEWAGE